MGYLRFRGRAGRLTGGSRGSETPSDSYALSRNDAQLQSFNIIGEASANIPDDQKLIKAQIDWRAITGLRNRIVHEDFGLSLSVIWAGVEQDLLSPAQQLREWPWASCSLSPSMN